MKSQKNSKTLFCILLINKEHVLKVKMKSRYSQLSNDEKIKLFGGPDTIFSVVSEDELNFFIREKRGFGIIEDFLLSIGGSEISGRISETKDHQIIDSLSIGMKIPFLGQYKTKCKQGVWYETKEFKCWDVFYWPDNEWLNCKGDGCYFKNLSIRVIPHANSIYRTEIAIVKKIKEEKGFFSKKQFVEHYSLYPFLDNVINEKLGHIPEYKNYKKMHTLRNELHNTPLDFWSFVEQNNFNEYFLDTNDIKILKDLYTVLDNFVIDIYKEYIEAPKIKKSFLKIKTEDIS